MSARQVSRLWMVAFVFAIASLLVSMYVGYRYVSLTNCLNDRDLADQRRTAAISKATDAERVADLKLIQGPATEQLRSEALAARQNTDRVRAAHPAPDVEPCG